MQLIIFKNPHFFMISNLNPVNQINPVIVLGDERTKQMLVHFVTGFPGVGKEMKKDSK
jgi:hypothetical protein